MVNQTQKTSYMTYLSPHVRRRHEHVRIGKKVISFTVQIELFVHDQWFPIVRYDTAHGFAHRDQISPNGKVDKVELFVQTFNQALDFAETDLRNRWQQYVDRFLKELNQ